jgi:GNAT superfamily N-acetyltransferase
MAPKIRFHQCSEEDIIPYFYRWAAAERWNPGTEGREVVDVFYKSLPKSFYLAVVPDKNDPEKENIVACVCAATYGEDMGWIGYYISSPEYRGQGYGLATFNHALKVIGERATVGLDGVLAQVKNYQKSGFTNSAWQSQRRAANIDHFISRLSDFESFGELNIMEISDIPFAELDALDARYSGFRRPAFLRNWIAFHTNNEEYGRFSCAVTANGQLLGYGCVRPAAESFRVGPLFAESPEVAKTILYHLAKSVSKALSTPASNKIPSSTSPVLDLDICAGNANAVSLFDELEIPMSEVTTIRMYKGKQPNADINGVYAATTYELG